MTRDVSASFGRKVRYPGDCVFCVIWIFNSNELGKRIEKAFDGFMEFFAHVLCVWHIIRSTPSLLHPVLAAQAYLDKALPKLI
ncbi:MAG: hypothetical protein WBY69_15690, partial [Candidatus Acidiferrales bacterium]